MINLTTKSKSKNKYKDDQTFSTKLTTESKSKDKYKYILKLSDPFESGIVHPRMFLPLIFIFCKSFSVSLEIEKIKSRASIDLQTILSSNLIEW